MTPEEQKKHCFFCNKLIEGKKNLEHIIPNTLLGRLGIKEEELSGIGKFQYSRIKVPAHPKCNSEFGSRYENEILTYLDEPESLFKELKAETANSIELNIYPSESKSAIVSTWLSKIYYGLFYNNYLKVTDHEKSVASGEIINSANFDLVRKAYQMNLGFNVPSSLYVFQSESEEFNLNTTIVPSAIMMKIKKLIFILVIGDGMLCYNYLKKDTLEKLAEWLQGEKSSNPKFPVELFAFREILSLRMSIPKEPSYILGEDMIVNMSFSTYVKNPDEYYKIDLAELNQHRKDIGIALGIENAT